MIECKAGDRVRLKHYKHEYPWNGAIARVIKPALLFGDPLIWTIEFEDPELNLNLSGGYSFHQEHFLEVLPEEGEAEETPTAPTVNKILAEWESDAERMLILETDLRGYGMQETAKALDYEAGKILKFTQALKWALKQDGLYKEKEETIDD